MFSQFIQPKKEGEDGIQLGSMELLPYAIHTVELSILFKTWELLVAEAG